MPENGTELGHGSQPNILIKASVAPRVNVAFHQNAVPVIAEIELANNTDEELNNISLNVFAVPNFLKPKTFRIDRIPPHGTQRLNPVLIDLDPKFLMEPSEAVNGEITIRAVATTSSQLLSRHANSFTGGMDGSVHGSGAYCRLCPTE